MSGPSASAPATAPRCSRNWTGRPCSRCRPHAISLESGKRRASISTITVERHFYSVPYALVHQEMDLHLTAETVEILHRGVRVASHVRPQEPGKATTLSEHRPQSHQKYLGRTPPRLLSPAHQPAPSPRHLLQ